jgi:hypothetical protein
VHDLANLWMADVDRMTRDEQHLLDARIFETLEEHTLAAMPVASKMTTFMTR